MNSITFNKQQIKPSKVVCIGRNFAAHIEELGNEQPEQPVVFVKPNSAISSNLLSGEVEEIHYEGEISFLIIDDIIAGVAFGLDLTKRETQAKLKSKGLPWERAKAFDASAVFSDFVPVVDETNDLRLELIINSSVVQQGGCKLMLNTPAALLTEVGSFMSFEDGDILMTGTPKGVGVVNQGDEFIGRIYNGDEIILEQSWLAH